MEMTTATCSSLVDLIFVAVFFFLQEQKKSQESQILNVFTLILKVQKSVLNLPVDVNSPKIQEQINQWRSLNLQWCGSLP